MRYEIINRKLKEKPNFTKKDFAVGTPVTVFRSVYDFDYVFVPVALTKVRICGHKWITLENKMKYILEDGIAWEHRDVAIRFTTMLPTQPNDKELAEAYQEGYRPLREKIGKINQQLLRTFASTNIRKEDFVFVSAAVERFLIEMKKYEETAYVR